MKLPGMISSVMLLVLTMIALLLWSAVAVPLDTGDSLPLSPDHTTFLHSQDEQGSEANVSRLLKQLKVKDPKVRVEAARQLGRLGDKKAIEPLIDRLKDKDSNVQIAAVEALGQLGDARAVGPSIRILKDRNHALRRQAFQALDALHAAPDTPEAHRERGLALLYNDATQAINELQLYLQMTPNAEDAWYIRILIEDLRSLDLSQVVRKEPGEKESTLTNPHIFTRPRPDWTEEARKEGVQGEVALEAVFAADGQVRLIRIIQGLGYGLDEESIKAARGIRFAPATRNGQPVSVRMNMRADFRVLLRIP